MKKTKKGSGVTPTKSDANSRTLSITLVIPKTDEVQDIRFGLGDNIFNNHPDSPMRPDVEFADVSPADLVFVAFEGGSKYYCFDSHGVQIPVPAEHIDPADYSLMTPFKVSREYRKRIDALVKWA